VANNYISCSTTGRLPPLDRKCSFEITLVLVADADWYYAEPNEAAQRIKGRVASWERLQVVE
jgi:hypothetical protein